MKIRKKFVAIWFIPVVFIFCTGWGESWQEVTEAAAKIHSIRSDFTQEKHLKILKKPLVSKGHLFYQSPDSLRWEYSAPVQRILMMHGGKTAQFVKMEDTYEKSSASGQEFMQIGLQEIARWLSGNFEETSFFSISLVPGEKIVLTAKEASISRFVNKIELSFSDRPGILKAVRIYESEESYTSFLFENTAFNETLDVSLFTEIKR